MCTLTLPIGYSGSCLDGYKSSCSLSCEVGYDGTPLIECVKNDTDFIVSGCAFTPWYYNGSQVRDMAVPSTENFTLEFCVTQDPYTGGTLYSIIDSHSSAICLALNLTQEHLFLVMLTGGQLVNVLNVTNTANDRPKQIALSFIDGYMSLYVDGVKSSASVWILSETKF